MTTVVFTLTGLNGESIPYTQFKVEAASPDGAYDPEYIVPSPVTFTTDALGKATVELAATNAPYFITRMTGSVDDFIAYKFFVPESTQPIAANMLYVDLGKQLKLSTDRSLYALIEAKVSMLHALDMAQTLATIVPAETIRTATNYRVDHAVIGTDLELRNITEKGTTSYKVMVYNRGAGPQTGTIESTISVRK